MNLNKTIITGLIAGLFSGAAIAGPTTITFDEAISTGAGFDGPSTEFLFSSDGLYKAEAFFLNDTFDHFHIADPGNGNKAERNHNISASGLTLLEGIRITRVDSGLFDLLSMDLSGEVAVGTALNQTTGILTDATLFSGGAGTPISPTLITFGAPFTGLSEVFLADPSGAGGTSSLNWWDNITMGDASSVPEGGNLLVIFGLVALLMCRARFKAVV